MILVHGFHAYLLALSFNLREIIMGIVMAHCLIMAVVYNSRLAWATPGALPPWIAKRVADSADQKPNQTETKRKPKLKQK